MKRMFDLLLLLAMSPLVVPVAIVVAAAIACERTGPVLYRSPRIGRGGSEFLMLKFRTMYLEGDRLLTPAMQEELMRDFKLANDPRVTPIGRWLRRTSLDELPQLINVLRGEMSLVGPRPKLPGELGMYGNAVRMLLSVPPGMTGYWQVWRSSCASDEAMRRMDLDYVMRRSLILDISLLLRTPWVIFTGRNA